jgi:myo-inositol-1(or 4)-monophosphatase
MRKSVPHEQELRAARRAALAAGKFLRRQFLRRKALRVELKGRADYVSRADRGSERIIRRIILRKFPDDGFLAEEGGLRRGRGERRRWLVDPLDGTTNFLHGFPFFAVSIAFEEEGEVRAAAVLDVMHGELFEARRGGGARLNGKPIRVSREGRMRHALLATGFPFRELERLLAYVRIFERMCRAAAGLRRPGSAALDLCYTACGRVDGFWEMGLSPWDVAAGALVVEEAGGKVTDLRGGGDFLKGDIAASNSRLHAAVLRVIAAGLGRKMRA